jgi:HEAT repeat protein
LASGAAPSLEKTFARAARLEGKAYATGRSLLERQGRKALPFLKGKAGSRDWQERLLARALILRIEQPQKTALQLRAFSGWDHTFTFREDGTVHVKFVPGEREYVEKMLRAGPQARPYGPPLRKVPPGEEVVLDREAVPILLDFMREEIEDVSRGSGRARSWATGLKIMKHMAAPESAPCVLSFYGKAWTFNARIADVLVSIGKPALPVLRDAILSSPTDPPKGRSAADRAKRHAISRSAGAALALGRIGDGQGASLLVEKLKAATCSEQVEAFSAALGRMKTPTGVPVILSQLVRAAGIYRRRRGGHTAADPEYAPLRDAMLAFGDAARAFLGGRVGGQRPLPTRVIAAGVLFELENPERAEAFYRAFGHAALAHSHAMYGRRERDGKERDPRAVGRSSFWRPRGTTVPEGPGTPSPLLAERACVFAAPADLVRLAGRRDCPRAFDVVADGLLLMRGGDQPKIALALAGMGDERAVAVYSKLLGDSPTHYVSPLVEAMLLLGSRRAVPLLEEIIRRAGEGDPRYSRTYQPAAELSKAVLPGLRGDPEHLVGLLEHEKESVREVAARVLAKNGDLRALPVLVELASSVPEKAGAASGRKSYATTTARRDRHVALRNAAVGLGQAAVAPLEGLRKGAADARKRLLCESIIVRVSKPELVALFTTAALVRHPGFMKRSGPGVGDYMGAGKTFAAAVGEEAIPLLEEVVTFNSGPPGPGIAIFALAEFKRERSIPVIVKSAMGLRPYLARGGNLVAAALHEFGEKGVEAAKRIPAPDPQKAQYRGRASRHRAATGALALAKEVKGVENILEGLAQPKQEAEDHYAWLSRMRTFLKLAKNYRDDRLVEPARRFLQQEHESLWAPALEVLADYDDPKTTPLALRCLGRHDNRTFEMALKFLVKRLRGEVVAFLVKQLRETEDERVRSGAAKALGALGQYGGSYWYQAFKERSQWEEAARKARSVAVKPLATALEDRSDSVRAAAAEALAEIGPRLRAEERRFFGGSLATWVSTQKRPSRRVVDYLVQVREPTIGPALLAVYRASGRKNPDLARMLGKAGYVDAIDDIARALDERIAAKRYNYGIPELKALGGLGAGGLDRVYAAFRDCPDLVLRAHAASVLGGKGYREAFGEIRELFEGLIEGGHRDPRLAGPGQARQRNYGSYVDLLAGALASLDPKRAYPVLSTAVLESEDERIRIRLSWRLQELERCDPTLRKLPVPLPDGP